MPLKGMTIVGLLEERRAIDLMQQHYVFPDLSPTSLSQEWAAARAQIGAPIPNAGYPQILDLPKDCRRAAEKAMANPRFKSMTEGQRWSFQLVEIAPLLAAQYHIVLDGSERHCGRGGAIPSVRDMVPICLPNRTEPASFDHAFHPHGVTIRSSELNFSMLEAGLFGADHHDRSVTRAGLVLGTRVPFVHVRRYEGRCYLANGYHRAYGFGAAGATHIPCLLLDANTIEETGLPLGEWEDLHNGANPPTCGHFTQGRARSVMIRRMERLIDIRWSETLLRAE